MDKGSGLRRLCAHLALTPSFAVAFGDGGNDIPLLTTAGYGVAVANARETLKAGGHMSVEAIFPRTHNKMGLLSFF